MINISQFFKSIFSKQTQRFNISREFFSFIFKKSNFTKMKNINFKILLFAFQIILFSTYTQATNFVNKEIYENLEKTKKNKTKKDEIPEDEIYNFNVVDVEAVFPGGIDKLQYYIMTNLKYPVQAMERKISGRVYVQFVIDKEGLIKNVKIIKGAHKLLNKEAIRVVKDMPRWEPALINDEPVNVSYTVPVTFEMLNNAETLNFY